MSKRKRPAEPAAPPPPAPLGPRLLVLGAAVLSGCGWFLATADFDLWPLAWIAGLPLFFAVDRAATPRRAFLVGWVCGIVTNAGGFYWITNLLVRFGKLPWAVALLAFALIAAYQGIVYALFGLAARRLRDLYHLPWALVAPLVMVTFELLVPFLFPWYLAINQAWQLPVIQIADLLGPMGVTAVLMAVNGGLYDLATRRRAGLVPAGAAALVLALTLGYGFLRLGQERARLAAAPRINVGVVQPNVGFDDKGLEHEDAAADQLADLQEQSRLLEKDGADLLVWPESSYPYWIFRDTPRDWAPGDDLRRHRGVRLPPLPIRSKVVARAEGVYELETVFTTPLVLGAGTRQPRGLSHGEYPYNSVLLLERDGTFRGRFDKTLLVLGSEYIPGMATFPKLWKKVLPEAAGHFARGAGVTVLPFRAPDGKDYRIAPMVCYEDIFPRFGRRLAGLRPHLMINVTNDTWFGDTSEPWQHLALSVFRAVEVRTSMVRAVNTGVSVAVDSTGKITAKTYAIDPKENPRGADRLLASVALVEGGGTVYARIGDLPIWLAAFVTFFLWLALPRYRSKGTFPSPPQRA